jgi:predicted RNA polymerase sigma factor
MLLALAPSPVVRLNRAIALRQLTGPGAALTEIRPLATALGGYHLFHATRAWLLRELGHLDEARVAEQRALELTRNPAERSLLRARMQGHA